MTLLRAASPQPLSGGEGLENEDKINKVLSFKED